MRRHRIWRKKCVMFHGDVVLATSAAGMDMEMFRKAYERSPGYEAATKEFWENAYMRVERGRKYARMMTE